MQKTITLTNYDNNASQYDQYRRPSPLVLESLQTFFSGAAKPILSIGCGTARMEQQLSNSNVVIGLDRSTGMLEEARKRIIHLTQGDMLALPYSNNSFDGAYFMQSLHHVGANLSINSEERAKARIKAIQEAIRTINKGPIVIIQRDPSQNMAVWFWHYFPQALEVKVKIQPKVDSIIDWLDDIGLKEISATPLMDPMSRNFFSPESPLDPTFRRSFSDFSYLSTNEINHGLERLQKDIENGNVHSVINACKRRFQKIGGTIFIISAKIVE